jgi:hypothetical protein
MSFCAFAQLTIRIDQKIKIMNQTLHLYHIHMTKKELKINEKKNIFDEKLLRYKEFFFLNAPEQLCKNNFQFY